MRSEEGAQPSTGPELQVSRLLVVQWFERWDPTGQLEDSEGSG